MIILTGYGSEKDKKDCLRLGAFKYLQKPIKINELLQHIQRAYKNKIESSMASASYLETGDFNTAKKIMN